jgi:hypothetical protein
MEAARSGIVGNHNLSLPVAAANWPTATVRSDGDVTENRGIALPRSAENWLTPGANEDAAGKPGANMQPQIKQQVEEWAHSRPDPEVTGEGSRKASGPPRLNPLFVEWLMGVPFGWTDYEPLGTEWSRWWQLMRSELLRLPWLDS